MPQAVFFDLDETLIRHSTPVMEQLQAVSHKHLADLSEALWQQFQRHLLVNVGELWNRIDIHSGRCEGEFTRIFRSGLVSVGHDVMLAEAMIEDFIAAVVDSTGPTEDAFAVLDALADAGIATGIITNGFSFLQKRKVKAHGLGERVRVVMTSEDAGAHKPDVHIFRAAMAPLGAAAADCWHVGDSYDKDIVGASNAGLKGVLYVPNEAEATQVRLEPAPFRVIERLSEIPQLIADAR